MVSPTSDGEYCYLRYVALTIITETGAEGGRHRKLRSFMQSYLCMRKGRGLLRFSGCRGHPFKVASVGVRMVEGQQNWIKVYFIYAIHLVLATTGTCLSQQ